MARRTKDEAQETRNALLDAAEEVFHRKGVAHTSLAEIASAASVTRGAVYWHFENKADLFNAMMQRVFLPLEAPVADSRPDAWEQPLEALRTMVLGFLDRVASDPRYPRVLRIAWHQCEHVGDIAAIRDSQLECGRRYLTVYEAAIRFARERGVVPTSVDPRHAAVGLIAVVDGLIVNWTMHPRLFSLAQVGRAAVDTYLAGLAIEGCLRPHEDETSTASRGDS